MHSMYLQRFCERYEWPRRLVQVTCAFCVLLIVKYAFCTEINPWYGRYLYEASYGKNLPGTGMVVEYNLTVNKAGETPAAILAMEGYQTNETIYCDVSFTNTSASFLFKKYDDGQTKNKYGVAQYKPGTLLFTLDRPSPNGFGGLVTHWKALNPDDQRKSGFKRLSEQRKD